MIKLSEISIPTHFVRRLNMREQLVREVEIIPVEVVIRNVAAGSLTKRFGMEEGTPHPGQSSSIIISLTSSTTP